MAVPSPLPSCKDQIRSALRAQRRAYAESLAPTTRAALEQALAEALDPLLFGATTVAAYFPMRNEVSPLPALERARAMGKTTALPFFACRDSRMTFRSGEPVDAGPWSILQPAPAAPAVSPDLLLIPLIAIDGTGNRIGMGKGHYDRTLPGLRAAGAKLIGAGWPLQLIAERLDPDPWDVPLHGFVSPDGLLEYRG